MAALRFTALTNPPVRGRCRHRTLQVKIQSATCPTSDDTRNNACCPFPGHPFFCWKKRLLRTSGNVGLEKICGYSDCCGDTDFCRCAHAGFFTQVSCISQKARGLSLFVFIVIFVEMILNKLKAGIYCYKGDGVPRITAWRYRLMTPTVCFS